MVVILASYQPITLPTQLTRNVLRTLGKCSGKILSKLRTNVLLVMLLECLSKDIKTLAQNIIYTLLMECFISEKNYLNIRLIDR